MSGTSTSPARNGYPSNPVVVHVTRAGVVESVHRGAWCLADPDGRVLAAAGDPEQLHYVRSAIKSLQALPLLESGAAERFGLSDAELAMAISSHAGERCHTETVGALLERLGLDVRHLACGVHPPSDAGTRAELRARGEPPSALHNNCSGKHAGFLALAQHLGVAPARYLDPESRVQVLVRRAIAELAGVPEASLVPGIDGCSAPTYRLSLRALATAMARIGSPQGLPPERQAHARRLTRVAAQDPVRISGSDRCLDTEILRATGGRLFPKIGAEAVHALAVVDGGLGLALKIDDGGARALPVLLCGLLEALVLAGPGELEALAHWRRRRLTNHAGLEVGSIEPVIDPAVRT